MSADRSKTFFDYFLHGEKKKHQASALKTLTNSKNPPENPLPKACSDYTTAKYLENSHTGSTYN
jgi:hypothetical protein